MSISYSEYAPLACPSCGAGFEADVWMLVDAAERSDLAQALRDDTLNIVACPKCGFQGPAGAPLLFHDSSSRRVYFAVPPGVEEHVWRERAQELLYQLVGGLPEEERRPYLGDVQIEHEVEGVRRALLRRERGRGRRRPGDQETRRPGDQETTKEADPSDSNLLFSPSPLLPFSPSQSDSAPVVEAVRALLAADSDKQFAEIVAANPRLFGDDADAIVRQLADLAYGEGERAVAAALRELRVTLARMRSGNDHSTGTIYRAPTTHDQHQTAEIKSDPEPENSTLITHNSKLSDAAYQALLRVDSIEELRAATRDYPSLLEEWADIELIARTEATLEEGNERLARTIEVRREALAELRAQVSGRDPLLQAVRALMEADGEAEIADVISAYPILLTDAAQDALFGLAAGARAQGDMDLAEYTISCRALLSTVRAGVNEH